ncbi:MAG: 3-phosphoserine/phosphohydroxythreonine transaminase [Armatimonadetes bacterium]|nr:3-phosphoserine/phosphohydroxythreonine transaminase [Armatimonadota bacterium]
MAQPHGRIFNFSAGPGTLPVEVLEQAKEDLLNYRGTGMSVMEMSHRSKAYEQIINEAEADLRSLMGIPEGYKVLFLQGGASLQFSMIPMSFLGSGQTADYVVTGTWGKKAIEAANMVGTAAKIFDAKDTNYNRVPEFGGLNLTAGAAYVHFTSNETIQGVEFKEDPNLPVPVVCDMSSNILSRPLDVSKYALIYAGAQKNMGPAGVALVVVREDFLAKAPEKTHPMLDYRLQSENGSMYNTPPCWTIYICGLVYKHLLAKGGLKAMHAVNEKKAGVVYNAIDSSNGFFKPHAEPNCRSLMNITFTLPSDELTATFISEAKAEGMVELKGHRSVGGCRASTYNSMPLEGCEKLAEFMKAFAAKNG